MATGSTEQAYGMPAIVLATVCRDRFRNHVTLTLDLLNSGQCMPSDYYRVYVYQVGCW